MCASCCDAGGAEAYVHGFCNSPSGSFRGPCFSDSHCKAACEHEYYKGDKSKPFTDGKCSDSGSQRLDGVGVGSRWSLLPTCICSIFCGSEKITWRPIITIRLRCQKTQNRRLRTTITIRLRRQKAQNRRRRTITIRLRRRNKSRQHKAASRRGKCWETS